MLISRYFFQFCLLSMLLFSNGLKGAPAEQTSQQKLSSEVATTPPADLVALIGLSKELSEGYVDLKNQLEKFEDLEGTRKYFSESKNKLNEISNSITKQGISESTNYGELVDIRQKLKMMRYNLKNRMEPINEMLEDVSSLEAYWSGKKNNWVNLSQTISEAPSQSVQSLMKRAEEIIDDALNSISDKLQILIEDKIEGTELDSDLYKQLALVESLISKRRALFTFGDTPIMFTPSYFSQYNTQVFNESVHGVEELTWPSRQFFLDEYWIILLQLFVAGLIAGLMIYFRSPSNENQEEHLLQHRPFSVGILVSIVSLSMFYGTYPPVWQILLMLIGWTAFARLLVVFIPSGSRRWFVYWLITSLVFTSIFEEIKLPMQLYRLFLLIFSLSGAFVAYLCARKQNTKEGMRFIAVVLGILSVLFFFLAILVVLGFSEFSNLLFTSTIKIISFLLIARLFVFIAKEGISWTIYRSPLKDSSLFVSQGPSFIAKALTFIYILVGSVILVASLVSWHLFDNPLEAAEGISSLGISLGGYRLTIGMVIGAVLIIYAGYFASWIIQTLLKENFFHMVNVSGDVGQSIAKIIHYAIMTISFLFVLLMMGFSMTNLTIIAGSLGIGVGLGLQEIVKNFAAGILVLFERPVRVGDTIEFDGGPCTVKKIGLRSTLIQTRADTEIVIPNNDLIMNPLTNWTLSQKRYRLKFPVGVAYDSDVAEVMRIMKECGEGCQKVLKFRPPQVIFMDFGESTLNFEMRVWIGDEKYRREVQTEINQELEKRFRMAGVHIAYPQLDVHIHNKIPES